MATHMEIHVQLQTILHFGGNTPGHPYSVGLLGSIPGHGQRGERLTQIPGMAPNMAHLPPGCAFAPRCFNADERCRSDAPGIDEIDTGRALRCHHPLITPGVSA